MWSFGIKSPEREVRDSLRLVPPPSRYPECRRGTGKSGDYEKEELKSGVSGDVVGVDLRETLTLPYTRIGQAWG